MAVRVFYLRVHWRGRQFQLVNIVRAGYCIGIRILSEMTSLDRGAGALPGYGANDFLG
jgi:hypothetical protein